MLQVHIESHSNVNLCPEFYLREYICHTEPFRKKSDGSCMVTLFLGSNRQHMPVCLKMILFLVKDGFKYC